jgi:hypothetical protein
MKKKLLVVAGSGASVEFGMPSVKEVNKILNDHLLKYISNKDKTESIYEYFKNIVATDDFEEIIYFINLLSSLLDTTNPINSFIERSKLPDLTFYSNVKVLDSHILRNAGSLMLESLVDTFRNKCRNVTTTHSKDFEKTRLFFSKLQNDFSLGILNLNYDNILYESIPGLYTGFDHNTGKFQPKGVLNRKEFDFIYHMHGSVHFNLKGSETEMHEIFWENKLEAFFEQDAFGRSPHLSKERIDIPNSAFIAGYGKPHQIQRYPFRIYYSKLDSLVNEADAFLFLGYGFKDLHINSAFQDNINSSKPVVIITYNNCESERLPWRDDEWSKNVIDMFKRDPETFGTEISQTRKIQGFCANLMEKSTAGGFTINIWHHGFLNSCDNYEIIQKALQ